MYESLLQSKTSLRRLSWAALFVPIAYLIVLVVLYHLDAPYWDQWEFVPILMKSEEGTLRLADFWAQQNESRLFFPKLVMFALAKASDWNHGLEVAANIFLGSSLFAALVALVLRTERSLDVRGRLWVLPVLSMLVFSLNQWRNWMWGFEIHIFLPAAALAWAIFFSTRTPSRIVETIVAGGLCFVATFSFTAGVISWVACGTGLVLCAGSRRSAATRAAGWAVATALAALLYVWGYEETASNHSPTEAFLHPLAFLRYVFAYIGAPVVTFHPGIATVAGIAGVLGAVVLGLYLLRSRTVSLAQLAPYISMHVYTVTLAALTAVKHSGSGDVNQVLSSRYMTWSTFFWVGLVCELYIFLELGAESHTRPRAARLALALILLFALLGSARGSYVSDERHDGFLIGRAALLEGRDDGDMRYLYPRPNRILESRDFLRAHRLSVFRELPEP